MRALAVTFTAMLTLAATVVADEGTLIVLNKSEATASLIDLEKGEEVKRVPVGEGPHEVAVSPDGRMAVVADYGAEQAGATLTVIDVVQGEVLNTIDLGVNRRPHGIMFLDARRVIVTTEASQSVVIVDVTAGEITNVIKTEQNGTHMVAVLPDGSRAFTTNLGSGNVTAIDLGEMRVIGHVVSGRGAEGIDVSPDGKEVWVSNRAENSLTVIDASTLHVLDRIDCGEFPIRLQFTPEGEHVLVSCFTSGAVAVFDAKNRKEIDRVTIDVPGTGEEMLGTRGPGPIGIEFAPGGAHAYIANANADVVSVIDRETWTIVDPLTAGKTPDGMGYSPLKVGQDPDADASRTFGS